jgi:outer membrane receptor for ferrienterochelin and colicins
MKTIKFIGLIALFFIANQSLAQSDTATFEVDGVCMLCEKRIEKAAKVRGVSSAEWDVDSHILTLIYNSKKVKLIKIHKAIAGVGHDTELVKASDKVYNNINGCCKYRDEEVRVDHVITGEEVIITTFEVNGVCGMCEERIEKAAKVSGVSSAEWNVDSHVLTVTYDKSKVQLIAIHKAIAAVGHDTKLVKASEEVYNNIHGCCKYRNEEIRADHGIVEGKKEESVLEITPLPVILKGKVFEIGDNDKRTPVYSANVFWLETMKGVTTDENGNFELKKHSNETKLIVSYVGTNSDSLLITDESNIEIILSNSIKLKGFTVVERQRGIEMSKLSAIKIEGINRKELQKAACCNLSESFETNPSVDVSYTDAVTGTKQIQMLGLSGANIQITKELLPDIRGFSSVYGMNFVPGDWIESIQLAKGVGSVISGYESIAGQINVELKKPDESEKFNVNLYANQGGRQEFNTNFKFKLNDKWSTGFLLHSSVNTTENDNNNDGFLDMPLMQNFIGINRWKYNNESNGVMGQIGVEAVSLKNTAGQIGFKEDQEIKSTNPWGAQSDISRIRGWIKIGKVYKESPGKSIGFQLTASDYNQQSAFGLTAYNAAQTSGYANLIFQNIIRTTDHSYFIGASALLDDYRESVDTTNYDRLEVTPGVYGEYTYSGGERFKAVLGARADYSNVFGFFLTPRLHLKYDLTEKTIVRLAAGRGQRTANIFAENQGLFATSRNIVVNSDANANTPYGLKAEVAWNFGVNLVQDIEIGGRDAVLSLDLYRTEFQNQIVVDWENPDEIAFYNLNGVSYSNSLQVQLDYELLPRLDVRLAYRYYDIKTTYNDIVLQKQLVAKNRAFINLGYKTKNEWSFDFTMNWIGEQRIASTQSNSDGFRYRNSAPDYFLSNTQITKKWGEKFSTYIGGENIFNFRQDMPIIDSKNPFGSNFDSSLVWAPIFGRNIYIGLRYTIQ